MLQQSKFAKKFDFDVLIVGAGMVGAAAACALGQAGMRVGLCDHQSLPGLAKDLPFSIRVSALNKASCNILDQLGAWSLIESLRACPYKRMAVWEDLKRPFSQRSLRSRFNQVCFNSASVGEEQLGFIVENTITQWSLHQVLAKLPEVKLFSPVKPISGQFDVSSNRLSLADGRQLSAPLIIGADGAHSKVREWAHLGLSEMDYEQRAFVATVAIDGGQQSTTWQAFHPSGPRAFLPLADYDGKSWASLVWYDSKERTDVLLAMTDYELLLELKQHFPKELPKMHALRERCAFPLTRRHAHRYVKQGVALLGDAAHTINPLAGQGVNLGFQDAAWLAQVVVEAFRGQKNWWDCSVLESYERIRKPENQKMQRAMDCFYYGFSNNFVPVKLLRNLGLTLAASVPLGQNQVMHYASGSQAKQPKLALGQSL